MVPSRDSPRYPQEVNARSYVGGCKASPGTNQARGCAILYDKNQVGEILEEFSDEEGRLTWLVTLKDKERYLFANIYGPNTKQDMFDENALNNIQNAVDKHGVHCLIVGGDLNVEIVKSQNRYISEYEQKALEIISEFCRVNNLEIVSDTENPTWFNKARSSKLDYILTNIKGHKWQSKNNWGVDKSDHSLID